MGCSNEKIERFRMSSPGAASSYLSEVIKSLGYNAEVTGRGMDAALRHRSTHKPDHSR